MKRQGITLLIVIILAVILSVLACRYYIYEIPHREMKYSIGTDCDLSKNHLIYNKETKKQICMEGEV